MSRKYALFVGSSEYEAESLTDLAAPIADVQDLANLFRNPSIGGFDEVKELIDSTESEIRQAIGSFFLNKKPDDLLLLYFSGHGLLDDRGHLYLAVKDTKPDLLRATAISADFVADDMDLSRSKRQILILDCCHSGAFRRGIKGPGKAVTAATFEGNGSGRIVLTASDRREFAMEGNQVLKQAQTSLFTHFLLEGIKSGKADRDGDSFISLDEWYDYAYDKVVSKLPTQTPRRWVYNQEGRLIIARNPKPEQIKSAELPPELRVSVDDDRPKIRLRATTELSEILNGRNRRLVPAALDALHRMQNDDNTEVKKAAARIVADYESLDVVNPSNDKIDWKKFWANWWPVLLNRALSRWKPWLIRGSLAVGIIISGWGLYNIFIDNAVVSNGPSLIKKQTVTEAGGTLMLSFNLLDISTQNQEPLIFIDEDKSEDPEQVRQKALPPSNQNFDQQQNKEQSEDLTDNISDPELENSSQQNLSTEERIPTESGAETINENPTVSEELPVDRVQNEVPGLQTQLKQAILDRNWSGVPKPLVDYYEKRLDGLYKNFNIVGVESTAGILQTNSARATLKVSIEISYQQKGRDDTKMLAIPANWIWEKDGETFVLAQVQNITESS